MRWTGCRCGLVLLFVLSLGWVGFAQDVQPPFKWEGKGLSVLLTKDGIENIEFKMKFAVDNDGDVSGEAFAEDGSAAIERLYYSGKENGVRQVIMVVILKDSKNPTLFLLRGRSLQDRLFYGEVLTKKYEEKGDIEKGLDIGNKNTVEITEDSIPDGVKTAYKQCKLIGCFKVEGDYAK